jgi:hypothetical protein
MAAVAAPDAVADAAGAASSAYPGVWDGSGVTWDPTGLEAQAYAADLTEVDWDLAFAFDSGKSYDSSTDDSLDSSSSDGSDVFKHSVSADDAGNRSISGSSSSSSNSSPQASDALAEGASSMRPPESSSSSATDNTRASSSSSSRLTTHMDNLAACFQPDWVVFIDSGLFFCKSDLQRLLMHQGADLACGWNLQLAQPERVSNATAAAAQVMAANNTAAAGAVQSAAETARAAAVAAVARAQVALAAAQEALATAAATGQAAAAEAVTQPAAGDANITLAGLPGFAELQQQKQQQGLQQLELPAATAQPGYLGGSSAIPATAAAVAAAGGLAGSATDQLQHHAPSDAVVPYSNAKSNELQQDASVDAGRQPFDRPTAAAEAAAKLAANAAYYAGAAPQEYADYALQLEAPAAYSAATTKPLVSQAESAALVSDAAYFAGSDPFDYSYAIQVAASSADPPLDISAAQLTAELAPETAYQAAPGSGADSYASGEQQQYLQEALQAASFGSSIPQQQPVAMAPGQQQKAELLATPETAASASAAPWYAAPQAHSTLRKLQQYDLQQEQQQQQHDVPVGVVSSHDLQALTVARAQHAALPYQQQQHQDPQQLPTIQQHSAADLAPLLAQQQQQRQQQQDALTSQVAALSPLPALFGLANNETLSRFPLYYGDVGVGRLVTGRPFDAVPKFAGAHPPTVRRMAAGLPVQVKGCQHHLTHMHLQLAPKARVGPRNE